MAFFYNLGIAFYGLVIQTLALFNAKAKFWVSGRKNWQFKLQNGLKSAKNVVWIHCASLGEFEQGRPLIEKIKQKHPKHFILLTFFSPSGYEIRKNYAFADYVCYLPLDTKKNAQKFISISQPSVAFFVKYEFWANYLFQLKRKNIPTYSIATLFRKNQHFFKSNRAFSRRILSSFSYFFVQNNTSKELLNAIDFHNVLVSGDTRYDRVMENASNVQEIPILKHFCHNETCLVIGSSWPVDEAMIFPLINDGKINEKVIIAPHEVSESHIKSICSNLTVSHLKYSECNENTDFTHVQVLIIDCIGLLASAYHYGTYAYIGGAFGKGLHNILEPASFGLPVIFGPKHSKFPEAQFFIDEGIGFSVDKVTAFETTRKQILKNLSTIKEKSTQLMKNQTGATQLIFDTINQRF